MLRIFQYLKKYLPTVGIIIVFRLSVSSDGRNATDAI